MLYWLLLLLQKINHALHLVCVKRLQCLGKIWLVKVQRWWLRGTILVVNWLLVRLLKSVWGGGELALSLRQLAKLRKLSLRDLAVRLLLMWQEQLLLTQVWPQLLCVVISMTIVVVVDIPRIVLMSMFSLTPSIIATKISSISITIVLPVAPILYIFKVVGIRRIVRWRITAIFIELCLGHDFSCFFRVNISIFIKLYSTIRLLFIGLNINFMLFNDASA